MKETLEKEKQPMQSVVDWVLEPGAVLRAESSDPDGGVVRISVDRFDILFSRPVLNADGAVAGFYYWAVCFSMGFDFGGPQHIRTYKMMDMNQARENLIYFTDHRGDSCMLESLDEIDDDGRNEVRRWREYKEGKKEQFEKLYRDFTAEHMEMALNMEAAGE